MKQQNEEKRMMKYLFTKGLRKLVSEEVLTREAQNRRAEVDVIVKRSKKIQIMLGEMSFLRKDLQTMRKVMEDLGTVTTEVEKKPEHANIAMLQKKLQLRGRRKSSAPLPEELVAAFDLRRMTQDMETRDQNSRE